MNRMTLRCWVWVRLFLLIAAIATEECFKSQHLLSGHFFFRCNSLLLVTTNAYSTNGSKLVATGAHKRCKSSNVHHLIFCRWLCSEQGCCSILQVPADRLEHTWSSYCTLASLWTTKCPGYLQESRWKLNDLMAQWMRRVWWKWHLYLWKSR